MNDKQIFDRIKQNIKEYFCDSDGNPQEILVKMDGDGRFPDLDYHKQNWTFWGPHQHISRLKKLCSIYAAMHNAFYLNDEIADAVHKGLSFFLTGNYRSENWWMNDVGVPTECGLIRLLFKENLNEYEDRELLRLANGNPSLPRTFDLGSNPDPEAFRPYDSEGMHMISRLVDTHVLLAVEDGDPVVAMEKIRDCISAINIELGVITYPAGRSATGRYGDEHCIKTDYSYHEHENQLSQNQYGSGMLTYFAQLCVFWKGTGLRPGDVAVREYINLLLDGYKLMRFKCVPPMMTIGRDVANADKKRYRRDDITDSIITVCDAILGWDVEYRKVEVAKWRDMNMCPEKTGHFQRTKYFWQSDFLSHNRKTYHFSVHGVSNRLKRPESILTKNVQGIFLGDGSYNLMQTGKEYDGMAPYMDWRKLAGTTVTKGSVNLNPESEITRDLEKRIYGGGKGKTSFVGGVSDEVYGFFAMDYDHFGVKAKKAWFCFDEGIVCLGAGICADNEDGVFTCLNQCKLAGNVVVDGKLICQGQRDLKKARYVLADGVGYLFLKQEERIYLANEERIGSWSRVDIDSGSDDPVSGNIFLLGIDHGKCQVSEEYTYMLLPDADCDNIEKTLEDPTVDILLNTQECQAVWHKKSRQLQAVFYKEGKVRTKEFTLEADKPCAVLLRFEGSDYKLWVSNPEHEESVVNVKIAGSIEAKITFNLDEGYMLNNLGRPKCYDSCKGFIAYSGAQNDHLAVGLCTVGRKG